MGRGALLAWSVAVGACASSTTANDDPADDPTGRDVGGTNVGLNRGELQVAVRFQRTAEGNWARGNAAFADDEFLAAQRYYQYIRTKFPYSRYAALSEVRIADCQYERQRFLEAIDTYQTFVRTHPGHEQVPYAAYRIGIAYYEQIPTDFFLLPPSHEKDQASVRDTERRLAEYVSRFPKDENFKDAKSKLDEVRRRLMAHERYVADFYRNLDRDRASVGRLEVIRRDFAEVGVDDELLYEIAETWAKVGEIEKAKSAADQLAKDFPASDLVKRARERIAQAEQQKAADDAKAEQEAAQQEDAAPEDAPPATDDETETPSGGTD